jgi:hypothetical protein
MKKMLFVAAGLFVFGCNSPKEPDTQKPAEAEVKEADTKITLPAKIFYDGTATIGKTENIAVVMNFNLDFIAAKLDNLGSYCADSVTYTLADGTYFNGVRDSAVAIVKAWRESMTAARQSYIYAIAVDNKDKGDEWVMQWIDEEHDYKNGKKEHMNLHEDYRMVNGKIREIFQYSQAVPAKK